jgi:glycosidase
VGTRPSSGTSLSVRHPGWIAGAALYQINTRQFTQEGTSAAAEAHLPRLRDLGVDVLWLMPIHEIGVERRKGRLGSPYAVRDHRSVSAELGGRKQFDRFVRAARDAGFRVILDWVANHTSPDHVAVAEHPEWFLRDEAGRLLAPPWCDWDDVIDLDYAVPGVRAYMADAMTYWVEEGGVDGFRCDVAGFVPLDFWEDVRARLDAVRPVFLLAEWEARDLHARAFDATYAWSWHEAVRRVVRSGDPAPLHEYYASSRKAYPPDALRMTFVSNHDKNAWEGTQFERFGDGLAGAIALSTLGEGIPLVYCGQEAGNPRRLPFFDRDPIVWRDHPIGDLYRALLALRKANPALHGGVAGGPMERVAAEAPPSVFAFRRRRGRDAVLVVISFSAESCEVRLDAREAPGTWTDALGGGSLGPGGLAFAVDPWGFRVFRPLA